MSVYCCSDLHGRYDLFQQIKKFIKPDDVVYVLGDCADRGKDGWKIICEVLDNPQFIYLKGNHEDMLTLAMRSYQKCAPEDRAYFFGYDHYYRMSAHNGGEKTFYDWGRIGKHKNEWVKRLEELPKRATYVNALGVRVEMSHAGFTPEGFKPDYLWDRDHFLDEWPKGYDNTVIVHGHTPIPYLMEDIGDYNKIEAGAYWYCNNHKICIDCGSVFTGCTTLLNLDTFDEEVFCAKDCVYDIEENA